MKQRHMKSESKPIELLAPAKNLACGIAAIDQGADAVYIGADRFGARVAAGNSLDDIAQLCRYAHQFEAKVYVTVNTIVYDSEVEDTLRLISRLQEIGVDAILVQDMGVYSRYQSLLHDDGSSISSPAETIDFHASTQTDNRTVEKVRWLKEQGFSRVVLARELSIQDIRAIHEAVPDVELEVFVHGALCVSYSGQCYASQYCFNRSANRGACAQFCRLQFNLTDANGKPIDHPRHWLSLRDMCRINHLEELLDAGAVSLKIEGRLKDIDYVKNVTAAYSQRLNQIISQSNGRYRRASRGNVGYTFTPNLKKTFNRGFTNYFLHGRTPDIFSPDTPKAMGEYVGKVKEIRGNSFTVAGSASFANGDGLCFFSGNEMLEGFRVNRVEGNRLFPLKMPAALRKGQVLYRNNDVVFERTMKGQTALRKIAIKMTLAATDDGFSLSMTDADDGRTIAETSDTIVHQMAEKPQRDNMIRQLSKLGGTPYECQEVILQPESFNFFIPASQLAEMRREVVRQSEGTKAGDGKRMTGVESGFASSPHRASAPNYGHPYLYNAANKAAREFYREQGISEASAIETHPAIRPLLMQCRHCLRYSLGYCRRESKEQMPWPEPLYLQLPDGRRFRLEFDCKNCQMNVYGER